MSQAKGAVEIENLPVGPNRTILEKWRAQPGELWVFQGPVRSYKSTLIETIAGHSPIPPSASVRVGGRVSYAMQQPWMQQATIKDNIVCCEPWNEERYKQVISACALTTDLSIMPLGDATPVAEKGISLSGGQRQRVALARAVYVSRAFPLWVYVTSCRYRIADIYLLDNPISALDDQTQEHIWTHLFEGLLQPATVIVGSSRPVISCTAVLNVTTNGVITGDAAVTKFNGFVAANASAKLPPRYSMDRATNTFSPPASSKASVKSSDVSVEIEQQSATFRSRVGSLQITLEQAAVMDVTQEVEAYARYADMIEDQEVAAEGGILASISSLTSSGTASSGRRVSFAEEMQPVGFRARSASFMDYYAAQQAPQASSPSDITATSRRDSHHTDRLPAEADQDGHRERVGSMRERVGSRRASFADFAEGSIGLTAASQHDLAAVAAIPEDAVLPEPPKPAPAVATLSTPAAATTKKPKHGLVRWVEAGKLRVWLIGAAFYPIAQTTRIISDYYVRFWTDNTYGLTQQGNLEVYCIIVSG